MIKVFNTKKTELKTYNDSKFEEILNKIRNLPILSIAHKLGHYDKQTFIQSGANVAGPCFNNHPSKSGRSFHFTPSKNLYHCWSCGVGGDNIQYIQDVRNCSFFEAVRWAVQTFPEMGVDIKDLMNARVTSTNKQDLEEYIKQGYNTMLYEELIKWGKELLYEKNYKIKQKYGATVARKANIALQYLTKDRNYNIELLKKTDISFIPDTKTAKAYLTSIYPEFKSYIDNLPLTGRYDDELTLVFPYRDSNGNITGLLRRHASSSGATINGESGIRWDSSHGLKKKAFYNIYKHKKHEFIILVEGQPDSEYLTAIGLPVVAIGSGLPSKAQLRDLGTHKQIKSIYISLDNDGVGIKNTETIIKSLVDYTTADIYILDPALLNQHKDLDEFTKAAAIEVEQDLVKQLGRKLSLNELLENLNDFVTKFIKTNITPSIIWYYNYLKNKEGGLSVDVINNILQYAVSGKQTDLIFLKEQIKREKHEYYTPKYIEDMYHELKEKYFYDLLKMDSTKNPIIGWNEVPLQDAATGELYVLNRKKILPKIENIDANSIGDADAFNRLTRFTSESLLKNYLKSRRINVPFYPTYEIIYNPEELYEFDLNNNRFNTYIPPKWRFYKKNDRILVPAQHFPTIHEYVEYMIADKEIDADFMYNWLSAAWYEFKKVMTSWVIVGYMGSGKNTIINILFAGLWGVPNVTTVGNAELTSQYNAYLEGKQVVVYNEINEWEAKTNPSIINKIKTQVTDPIQSLNKKYAQQKTIKDYSFKIFISNALVPIQIDQEDRRFHVFSTPRRKLIDSPFFKRNKWTYDDFIKKVEEEYENFVQYLLNYDYDLKKANSPVLTSTKALAIKTNKSPAKLLIEFLLKEDLESIRDFQLSGHQYSLTNPIEWNEKHRKMGIITLQNIIELVEALSSNPKYKYTTQKLYTDFAQAGLTSYTKVSSKVDGKHINLKALIVFPDRYLAHKAKRSNGTAKIEIYNPQSNTLEKGNLELQSREDLANLQYKIEENNEKVKSQSYKNPPKEQTKVKQRALSAAKRQKLIEYKRKMSLAALYKRELGKDEDEIE